MTDSPRLFDPSEYGVRPETPPKRKRRLAPKPMPMNGKWFGISTRSGLDAKAHYLPKASLDEMGRRPWIGSVAAECGMVGRPIPFDRPYLDVCEMCGRKTGVLR